jgi:hypothetical protein
MGELYGPNEDVYREHLDVKWITTPWPPELRASDESGLKIVAYALGAAVVALALGWWVGRSLSVGPR